MVGTDLRQNHRSGARPATNLIAYRMGDWRPSENPSSPPTFPAAARGRAFPWTCAECSTRGRDRSVDPYTRTEGCHGNHAHEADRSDHRGITWYWPRNRAEAR